ncbi:hypothetical protein SAMN04488103_101414 [Gemmobacter aquatilis]|uniref:Uncharacterized protein n=1 Tax=Gemmobacter aquatilis TaxID=933059 RepID=A0A1H7Z630_9RHOB|nr:hypothetical protein [Gemmobacter aquatilis]SEM53786.1 hypothetical protein SAMN04488103_101414 [Gemmobacter aquatilis]
MNRFAAVCCLALIPSGAWSQTVSDAALAECQADGKAFTSVKECLPETELALQMLTAVASPELYGDAGAAIVSACAEVNEMSPQRWACVRNAISDAVELLEMVGSADKIADARFKGVSDPAILEKLKVKEDAVQATFGDHMWGGTMFYKLK